MILINRIYFNRKVELSYYSYIFTILYRIYFIFGSLWESTMLSFFEACEWYNFTSGITLRASFSLNEWYGKHYFKKTHEFLHVDVYFYIITIRIHAQSGINISVASWWKGRVTVKTSKQLVIQSRVKRDAQISVFLCIIISRKFDSKFPD